MPTITVDRQEFFAKLGKEYSEPIPAPLSLSQLSRSPHTHLSIPTATHDFDELLFEYGLELDEDPHPTTSPPAFSQTTTDPSHPKDEPHQLKIEVPANRYDLLCSEGIVRALKLYLNPALPRPDYRLKIAPQGLERTVHISAEVSPSLSLTFWSPQTRTHSNRAPAQTAQIRPYFASAILRNVNFTKLSYASFIDLQDKLHQNLARRRTLVAIGTHDLDQIAPGDITYEALPPKDIKFAPLNKTTEYDAVGMMKMYKEDKHLSKYLHIIEDSPVYPIIYDSTRQVLSMPPIINSNKTKITLDTKNVFIDVTATDETKLGFVIDVIVTMFSEYCAEPFTVEPVRIVYGDKSPGGARTIYTPNLTPRPFVARASYINSCTGLTLPRPQVIALLQQMGLDAFPPVPSQAFLPLNDTAGVEFKEDDKICVRVPATRPDILHECDLMEDAAVAYGFNKLLKTFPKANTVGKPLKVNKLSDTLRRLCSESGWIEVLPLILCSHDENFKFLNRKDPGNLAVVLANPKTIEYQVVRTSLLPGILKTIRENKKHALPLRVFEVSDIVVKDDREERMARNDRRVAGIYCGRKAGFEVVHGLLDRLMLGLGVKVLDTEVKREKEDQGYYIKSYDDPTYFPGRAAEIYYRRPKVAGAHTTFAPVASADASHASVSTPQSDTKPTSTLAAIKEKVLPTSNSSRDIVIGSIGILHPSVLKAYELDYPCSALEFDLEPFL